ncbi:MAG TPA: MFS transporter [Acetobacteraceae bacterium]|nr:MFS transporter [Acetobacteraceae bacterium]
MPTRAALAVSPADAPTRAVAAEGTVLAVLLAISFSHMLNDTMQSLIPASYPLLKTGFGLTFAQVGLITLTFQLTASLLQPLVGLYTDRHPLPFSLAAGMGFTLCGLLLLSIAGSFPVLLAAVALVGMGSSVFHPEASRVARLASGGRHGFAQSIFQVGGNAGSALGPLLAAFIVVPHGRESIGWFSLVALLAMTVLGGVGLWYRRHRLASQKKARAATLNLAALPRRRITISLAVLVALVFSKFFYMASMTSYYTFYLMSKFQLPVQSAQIYLFVFLGAVAAGTIIGGPLGDRFGRKYVIWASVLGVFPFTFALPFANLFWTGVLTVPIGLILASAFPAIIVYATELVPGKVGMIAGLFFGLAFGLGGLGAAVLGELADLTSIRTVYHVCAFLPLIGLLTALLPNLEGARRPAHA